MIDAMPTQPPFPPVLSERLAAVLAELRACEERAGRSPGSARLVVITKAAPASIFAELQALGVTDVGENRVQDAEQRMAGWERAFRWHLVGHLQANKARRAVERFDVFHGVDSLALMLRLDRFSGELGRRPELLLQVNVSGEASKHGIAPEDLPGALEAARGLAHARVTGLMTMAPQVDEPEQARPVFAALARLSRSHRPPPELKQLSMGMSDDFAVAVEEGATLVRVGRRIVAPDPG